MSYTVQAGGSGYSAPTMSYYSNGTKYVTTLSTQATTYYMDNRSSWSVSAQLPGSTPVERWATTQSTGNATSSKTITIVYDHQFLVTIAATPAGEGTTRPSGSNWFEAGSQVRSRPRATPHLFSLNGGKLNSSISFENYKASSTSRYSFRTRHDRRRVRTNCVISRRVLWKYYRRSISVINRKSCRVQRGPPRSRFPDCQAELRQSLGQIQ